MTKYKSIDEANEAIAKKIIDAQPTLVDVVRAKTVIPELEGKLILHAGPPIAFERHAGPGAGRGHRRGAVRGLGERRGVRPTGVFGGGPVRAESTLPARSGRWAAS